MSLIAAFDWHWRQPQRQCRSPGLDIGSTAARGEPSSLLESLGSTSPLLPAALYFCGGPETARVTVVIQLLVFFSNRSPTSHDTILASGYSTDVMLATEKQSALPRSTAKNISYKPIKTVSDPFVFVPISGSEAARGRGPARKIVRAHVTRVQHEKNGNFSVGQGMQK